MERIIANKLIDWKKAKNRKPLVIRGARQVGKTYSVNEFGNNHFESFVLFDFERNRSIHEIFSNTLDPGTILQQLEVYAEKRIIPGKTLIFFDEIQACERAMMSLRYFYEELPEQHIIAAGSLLEFSMGDISFPVGRITFQWMHPMTFIEFLNASGKAILADQIPSLFNKITIPETIHRKIIKELKKYFLVGGMPEAVKRFIETGSFNEAKNVHQDISQSYLQSLVKYDKRADLDSLNHLIQMIPQHVGSQIKYTSLDPERRIEKTKSSLQILEKALLIHQVKSCNASGLPLGATALSKVFKILFLDIGLMQHICGIDPKTILKEKDLSTVYKGALAEQFVGQELLAANGSENSIVYYWSRRKKSSNAEIDYLIVKDGNIFPIEVKSGSYGRMKSMHIFLEEHPNIEKGFVLSPEIYEKQTVKQLEFLPFYCKFV